MNIATLRQVLLYCTIINFGVLALWVALALPPHYRITRWAAGFWGLPPERVAAINFAGLVLYKAAILFFNLIPYLVLRIVG